MTRALQRHWARWRQPDDQEPNDSGMTLLAVLAVLFLVTAFLLVGLAFTVNNLKPSRENQDAKAAAAAAQAGLDDYLGRLTADQNYWRNNNVDSSNPAFTGGSGFGTTGAKYTYKVVKPPKGSNGNKITLSATGTVNGVSRTMTTTFGPDSFLKYVYFSDKENLSPLYTGSTSTRCTQRWWEGRNGAGCTEIQFANGDRLDGPVHTNDTPLIGGTVNFTQKVTTATRTSAGAQCSGTSCYRATSGSGFSGFRPEYDKVIPIPSANTELADNARTEGCYYTGATHITFVGNMMRVYSPETRTINDPTCFNPSNRTAEQVVPIKPAIYVGDLTGATCTQDNQKARGFPRANESTSGTLTPSYACNLGTAYVRGTMTGDTTIGTSQDVVITGNLRYATDPKVDEDSFDIMGLVPGHSAWVYHPMNTSGTEMLTTAERINRIDAAILTIQDSFIVQHYDKGSKLGNLTVYGSLAQNYRGTVGTAGGTGYTKDYQYDRRFASGVVQPTFFLKPTSAQWKYDRVNDN